jgi:hypothetical protein
VKVREKQEMLEAVASREQYEREHAEMERARSAQGRQSPDGDLEGGAAESGFCCGGT